MIRLIVAVILGIYIESAVASLPVNKMESRVGCGSTGSCKIGQGTAIPLRLMDDSTLIWATAGHCIGDWNAIKIGGDNFVSHVVARVPVNDLIPDEVVYLRTQEKVSAGSVELWSPERVPPKVGDKVWLIGYPLGKYIRRASEVLTVDGDQFTVLPHADVGASGGGVFLQSNRRLVGMIHAYYRGGRQRGIASRWDLVNDRLERDGHSYLVPRRREQSDTPSVADTPVADIAQDRLEKMVSDALAAEKKDREERENRAIDQRRAEEREKYARHAKQISDLQQKLESLRGATQEAPVTPPITKSDPNVVEQIEGPVRGQNSPTTRVPWGLLSMVAGVAGLAVPGGAIGVWGIKKLLGRKARRKSPPVFRRDTSEAEQLLQLRAEERSPVNDAVFGMLWQDFAKANPTATIKDAEDAVLRTFNQIAPLSTQETPE